MTTNPEQDRPVDPQSRVTGQDPATVTPGQDAARADDGTSVLGDRGAGAAAQDFAAPAGPGAPAPEQSDRQYAPQPPAPQHQPQPQGDVHAAPQTHSAHSASAPYGEQPTTPLHDVHRPEAASGAGAGSAFGQAAAYPAAGYAGQQAHGAHETHGAHEIHGALGGHDGSGGTGGAGGAGHGGADGQAHPKSRTGALLAGLAIGALLGGAVGGGVAAVVASNVSQHSTAQGSGTSQTITLNNAENATAISGVAAVALPSVVTLEVASNAGSGSGSGVVYSSDGYIVTNAHVVTLDGAATSGQTIRVKLSDGRILDGTVAGIDPYADLAVVKVDATDLPAIKVADSDKLDVGDLTVAIGAPLNLANTVTSGVVSALNRGISVQSSLIPQQTGGQGQDDGSQEDPWDFRYGLPDGSQQQPQAAGTATLPVIQTDASINPGNSGGALLNGHGELIGVNVAIASTAGSSGTAGSDGLGFALPANLVTRVADAIIAGEQPTHGLMGASVADSSQDTDEDANRAGGLLVEIVRGGAADKAGLKVGDVVTAVDGVPAVDGTSVSALVRMHEGGSTVTVDYTRGGREGQAVVRLGVLTWSPLGGPGSWRAAADAAPGRGRAPPGPGRFRASAMPYS